MASERFDTKAVDDLDARVTERLERPTLVSKLQEKKVSIKKDRMSFSEDLRKYWFIYAILGVSAIFTGTLGFYMGISPERRDTGIYYHTDFLHLFLAFVYMVAFITVTEGAFLLGKHLLFNREQTNPKQFWTSLTIMIVSGISVFLTGIAGGLVIASTIDFMTIIVEVPRTAQTWIIIVIPGLLSMYAFLLSAYQLTSKEAASERITKNNERNLDLDHRTRKRTILQIAKEDLQVAELNALIKKVKEGTITAADAMAQLGANQILGTANPAFDVKQENLDESKK